MWAEITVAAANAGVNGILGEKPMAAFLGEANDMIEVCEKHGVMLALGHQGRFSAVNTEIRRLIRRLIRDGAIGENQPCFIDVANLMPACLISAPT